MFTVYKITNLKNKKYYVGVHKTNEPMDDYMGSGVAIKRAIQKHGIESFVKEILYTFDNERDAYVKERELLEDVWQNAETYNMTAGGVGSWSHVDSTGENNCMKRKDIVEKVRNTKIKNNSYRTESAKEAQIRNLQKAVDSWSGSNHTQESREAISTSNKMAWERDRERLLSSIRMSKPKYTLMSPDGDIVELERGMLNEWCTSMGFPVSAFSTKPENKPIKKGRAKGWKIVKRQ